jgi:hypothetical protein
MSGSELQTLFAVFGPEDWSAFRSGLEELSLRYFGLRCRSAFELFWMEIEELVRELASDRLEHRAAELVDATVAP